MIEPAWVHASFQPVVDLSTSRTVGVATTLRTPSAGVHHPLAQACRDFRYFLANLPDLDLVLDTGPVSCTLPELVDELASTLSCVRLSPQRVVLGLSGLSAFAGAPGIKSSLEQLTRLGVRIATDDFGTDPDSLRMLRFPLHTLNISADAVEAAVSTVAGAAACGSAIKRAHEAGVTTTARGVSRRAGQAILRLLNCDRATGPLWGGPQPRTQTLAAMVAARRPPPREACRSAAERHELRELEVDARIASLHAAGASFAAIATVLNHDEDPATDLLWTARRVSLRLVLS